EIQFEVLLVAGVRHFVCRVKPKDDVADNFPEDFANFVELIHDFVTVWNPELIPANKTIELNVLLVAEVGAEARPAEEMVLLGELAVGDHVEVALDSAHGR